MKKLILVLVALLAPLALLADGRIFEMRTYTTNPGKLDDLHKRFSTHTNHIFVKHGMTLIGYWTPTEGPGGAEYAGLHAGLPFDGSPRGVLEGLQR